MDFFIPDIFQTIHIIWILNTTATKNIDFELLWRHTHRHTHTEQTHRHTYRTTSFLSRPWCDKTTTSQRVMILSIRQYQKLPQQTLLMKDTHTHTLTHTHTHKHTQKHTHTDTYTTSAVLMTVFKDSHHFSRTLGSLWWQSSKTAIISAELWAVFDNNL